MTAYRSGQWRKPFTLNLDFGLLAGELRAALITNDVNPRGATPHRNTHLGGYRPLDLCAAPYHLAARSVFTFRRRQFFLRRWLWPRWEKQVLLWDREAEATPSR